MRKISQLVLVSLLVLLPVNVYALTGSISVSCAKTEVGADETFNCNVTATSSADVTSLEAKITLDDKLELVQYTPDDGWSGGDETYNKKIEQYPKAAYFKDDFNVGVLQLKVKAGSSGTATLSLTNVVFYDENDALNNHYYNSTTDELYERYMDGASFLNVDFLTANIE